MKETKIYGILEFAEYQNIFAVISKRAWLRVIEAKKAHVLERRQMISFLLSHKLVKLSDVALVELSSSSLEESV